MRKRRVIGMDEFSIEKRHTYATVITDPIHREIVDTFEKRDEETVVEHLSRLPHKESIQAAVIDMSRSFRSAIREALPGCHIVADKFHVVATVIDALDRVRKRVQREKAKGHRKPVYDLRYKLRKGRERLDDEETHELWTILAQEPDLRIAYFLKEAFRDWYHRVSRSSAQRQLELWCDWAKASGLPEMLEAARTLQNWKEEISNYFT
jgi:transposase